MKSLRVPSSFTLHWLYLLALLATCSIRAGEFSTPPAPTPEDWRSYLAEDTRTHYSALAQINTTNVAQLTQVWTFRSVDPANAGSRAWRGNPIIIAGTLVDASPENTLVALDAATGEVKWRFDPAALGDPSNPLETILGVAAPKDIDGGRIYFASNDHLYAVDAATGRAVESFGVRGRIDLLPGIDRAVRAAIATVTAPVTVIGDKLVVASSNAGGVHAFDAQSGESLWKFVAPVDSSSAIASDLARQRLFLAATDTLHCLDASDGRELWRRENIAPRPEASSPVLFTLHRGGSDVPALALATADGRVLAFDKETGEPLFSDAAGYAVVPPLDARNKATSPAVDPDNRLFLAAGVRALAATHLASQEILWRGHPITPPSGGDPIVTGGDLVFRGTKEGILALDSNTGTTLWNAALPFPPTGTPATYRTGGRQFVVVPAGGALVAFALPLDVIAKPVAVARPPERFDEEIARIEARLKTNPPAPGGIVFSGSSTFTLWNVSEAFPDLPVTNLGFGGSQITDINHYAARLLLPLRPRLVVFYCGSNDVGANFSYDEIIARWRTFSEWMDANLPETHVLVLSNLPTPRRWIIWPDMHGFNALLAAEVANHPRRHYFDGTHIMLDPDGRLRVDRISSDILHMNATGNAAMAAALRPAIDAIWARVNPR